MANMDVKSCGMPVQKPQTRNKNFSEVALGYTLEMAMSEAKRCLNCKDKPCVKGCPVNVDIPAFVDKIAKGEIDKAYEILSRQNSLPAVCGRVCPQESQCEAKCVRGIKGESVAIGRLERFAADYHANGKINLPQLPKQNEHKVAVVGSGPSGLAAAGDLARLGYTVTIYEALHTAGGVLVYGIPEFRLPKAIVQGEIQGLKALGVEIETNMVIGRVLTVEDLFAMGNEAVYIASGAGLPQFMGIAGESLNGVYSANEYLTRINLMKGYEQNSKTPIRRGKSVAVVGGGNVAMDGARCAKRLGAENVYIVYRRGLQELPARREEVEHAREEGIEFKLLTSPVEILGDEKGEVCGIKCVEMELGEPDASGRRRPSPKANSEFNIEVDTVIMAIGTSPNPLISSTTPDLETDRHGCIITKGEGGLTTKNAVYAGGDAVTGAATVILAMGAGKHGAKAIDEYIKAKNTK
ncbi:MAG: NADPH-dependent glutamate synthase [Oscillospiraceae bacterium]